ncbi:MAG: TRAP transporter small permease subunit [Rhodobacteraceae bacterium]|jgi:TRAP-type C4-dicarboxylate transport system permease small subunit|nr:TRAP transporter small permease subunit [Paracoccaceae bacterium]NCX58290.1 TRAP transporter small permease subunit [Paracoccaceae bacterium]
MLNILMKRLSRVAEAIAAIALAAIFIVFLLQIFTRYSGKLSQWMPVENLSLWMSEIEPLRWTVYLISLLWVWLIFLGCSFVVRERDHVAFDILYQAAPPRLRKIMTILGAIILIAVMLISLPATWQAIMANRLMELKKLQTLRLPITGDKIAIKWLFFPYLVLMAILIIRSCSRIFLELRTNNQNTEVEET